MPKAPIANIIFGTMTLGYRGYGARVHDAATADSMLGAVLKFGHDQLDACSVYGDGTCEQMLGDASATMASASMLTIRWPAVPLLRILPVAR
jgi:aflatoxin B1 aldehyde reductase